jgi:phosphate/sulfate permease
MNPRSIGVAVSTTGVVISAIAGSVVARRGGFGDQSWLMGAFALGIIMAIEGRIIRLRQQIHEIQSRKTE